jgi:GNAT superfamily N-acetyltransferase
MEQTTHALRRREAARIRAFFVHPAWARQGIGRRIIDACEAAARAEGFTRMELVATLPGEPLYRACGYAVAERFAIALPDGIQLPVARMGRAIG